MKKLILPVIVASMLITPMSVFASEIVAPDAHITQTRASGNWYSSTGRNLDGFSKIQTTNNSGKIYYFTYQIKDISGGDLEYNKSTYLSSNESYNSGLVPTTISHTMQGVIKTTCSSHSPKFDI